MAIKTAACTSFKVALLSGEMDFSANTVQVFKLALYTSAATLGAETTAYTTTDEVPTGGGYLAGGKVVTISSPAASSGNKAVVELGDVTWASSTISTRGALLYSTSAGNPSVLSLNFIADQVTSNGNFIVKLQDAIGDILSLN